MSRFRRNGALVSRSGSARADDADAVIRRTEAILDGVGDGVFITDGRGRVKTWNGAAERLTAASRRRAVGHDCAKILGFCKKQRATGECTPLDCSNGCAVLDLLKLRAPGSSIEVTRKRAGAADQQILVNASVVEGVEGDVDEVVHSMRDITRLKEADDAKTMFLATASHELKTSLTVILGFTQTLLAEWLDEQQTGQALRSIEKRAKQLSRIVDRLLLTGRIEAGRVLLDLATVPLTPIIKEQAESYSSATGRTISCETPDDLPNVIADTDAITTVLDHLIDNALKYSPDGGEVTIRAVNEGNSVMLEVSDQGIGMSPDEASVCFERFWQAEQSDVRRFGGTGVGLYIVKSMTEGMGGAVSVRSTIGKGSTFVVTLRKAEHGVMETKDEELGVGPRSMIQEFMRQLGVPPPGGGGGEG